MKWNKQTVNKQSKKWPKKEKIKATTLNPESSLVTTVLLEFYFLQHPPKCSDEVKSEKLTDKQTHIKRCCSEFGKPSLVLGHFPKGKKQQLRGKGKKEQIEGTEKGNLNINIPKKVAKFSDTEKNPNPNIEKPCSAPKNSVSLSNKASF